jgi:hypothetical protein
MLGHLGNYHSLNNNRMSAQGGKYVSIGPVNNQLLEYIYKIFSKIIYFDEYLYLYFHECIWILGVWGTLFSVYNEERR